jgi:hypothetical protein
VLKLKATNIKDKAPVTFTSLKESSLDNATSSCDIVSGEPTCTDVDADNETAQFKDDTAHEQSFEGKNNLVFFYRLMLKFHECIFCNCNHFEQDPWDESQ